MKQEKWEFFSCSESSRPLHTKKLYVVSNIQQKMMNEKLYGDDLTKNFEL